MPDQWFKSLSESYVHVACPQASPMFCSLVFVQYNTREWKSGEKWVGLFITWMTSGGRREEEPIVKYVWTKLKSEFLSCEDEEFRPC